MVCDLFQCCNTKKTRNTFHTVEDEYVHSKVVGLLFHLLKKKLHHGYIIQFYKRASFKYFGRHSIFKIVQEEIVYIFEIITVVP